MDIVCLSLPAWEGNYLKSTVELMKELARNNKVLFVDYPYTWVDVVKKKGIPRNHILGLSPRMRTISLSRNTSIHVLSLPPLFPTNWIKSPGLYRSFMQWHAKMALSSIRKSMKSLQMDAPVVINAFNPFLGVDLAGKLNEELLLYYCYDEINAADWLKTHGGRLEIEFSKLVDGIIVTSKQLQKTKSKLNANCQLVKNGVDFNLFGRLELQPRLLELQDKPIIGYLGTVGSRLDYALLKAMAQKAPHYNFVFVGRTAQSEGVEALKRLSNVYFLGPKPPSELPDYVSGFSVGIIPFLKNDLTAGIYPLKINEYLATGIPVVTTHFSDLSDFKHIVAIADKPNTFLQAIDQAIETDHLVLRQKRRHLAQENSWAGRAATFQHYIEQLIQQKRITRTELQVI